MTYPIWLTFLLSVLLLNLYVSLVQGSSSYSGPYECLDFSQAASNEQHCYNSSFCGYKMFTSRTTYLEARKEMAKVFNPTFPKLEGVDGGQCTPVYLYFLTRHTIRYPTSKNFAKLFKQLPSIREVLLASGKLNPLVANELTRWRLMMHSSESGRVTMSGKFETHVQARIFYQHFPTLLDMYKRQFEVRCTGRPRTRESAEAFVRSLVELQVRDQKLTFDASNALVDQVIKDKFPITANDQILQSYRNCSTKSKSKSPDDDDDSPQYNQLKNSKVILSLVERFKSRNGLPSADLSTISLIYSACAYEMSHTQYSAWCHLFTLNELKALEYMADVKYYYKINGPQGKNEIAGVVIEDLYEKLYDVVHGPQGGTNWTTLYFSHNGLFKRLVGFLKLFNKFPDYALDGERLFIPQEREWRSSFVFPYGTNLAVVLYRCDHHALASNKGKEEQFKLLTLYNEIPIKLPGCDEHSQLCSVRHFFKYYKNLLTDREEICD